MTIDLVWVLQLSALTKARPPWECSCAAAVPFFYSLLIPSVNVFSGGVALRMIPPVQSGLLHTVLA